MRGLAACAHILLPNATEFNLLAGLPPSQELPCSEAGLLELARGLDAPRLKYIVITSARPGNNVLIDIDGNKAAALPFRDNSVCYSGTGDLFASALCGFLLGNIPVADAARLAAEFVADAAQSTPEGADARMGAVFEPLLKKLIELGENYNEKR